MTISSSSSPGPLRIGEWRLDPAVRSLSREGEEHRLEPKMLDVLLVLIEGEGRPVDREHIERTVWSGAAVGTDLLNRTVWKLRQVLRDDPSAPAYIETIPRTGYRLVADVRLEPEESAPSAGTNPPLAPPIVARPGRVAGLVVAGLLVVVAGALVLPRLGARTDPAERAGPATPLRIAPLTTAPGYEAAPSLSPDGRWVAYQRYDPSGSAQWDVHILEVADGSSRPLATAPAAAEYAPTWSPRGDTVAYVRQEADGTCSIVVHPLDGEATSVAACAPGQSHELSWLPDGQLVMASSGPSHVLGLVRIPRDGGAPLPLTTPPEGYQGDVRPRVSPDGRSVAFVRERTAGVSDVWVLDLGTLEPRRLTQDHRRVDGLAWTPDGHDLVFSSTRGGASQLWRVPVAGGPPTVLPMSGRNASRISMAAGAAGPTLVYEEYFGDADLWTFDPASGTHEPWAGSNRSEWAPVVSPDGAWVAFLSDRTGAAEVWLLPSSGGQPTQVTRLDGAAVDPPRWLTDSSRLVFGAAVDGEFDLYTVARDGTDLRRLSDDPVDERTPSWWNGEIVYAANRTGTPELWAIPAEGGPSRRLTSGGGWAPRPSADGSRLLHTRSGESGLWALDPDGTVARIAEDVAPGDWGNWLPTPDGIVLLRVWGGNTPVLERLTAGGARTLATIDAELPDQAGVTRLPNGRLLYGRVVRSESDLWIVQGLPGG